MKRILIPLPTLGADPSEVAIVWKLLSEKGFETVFITPNGQQASVDQRMLKGNGLGIFKSLLGARIDAVEAFYQLKESDAFCHPLKYTDVKEQSFDAIYLPGGHDKTVKEYLESSVLQQLIVDFFHENKLVAAICHGVVLVARSIDERTSESVLYDYKTTALLKSQELLGYNLTRLWLKDYYLTYPEITVQDEVTQALKDPSNFISGSFPLLRDTPTKLTSGFVVCDKNYISARWPGDLYSFSLAIINKLEATD